MVDREHPFHLREQAGKRTEVGISVHKSAQMCQVIRQMTLSNKVSELEEKKKKNSGQLGPDEEKTLRDSRKSLQSMKIPTIKTLYYDARPVGEGGVHSSYQ
jgi:hypothetical protein